MDAEIAILSILSVALGFSNIYWVIRCHWLVADNEKSREFRDNMHSKTIISLIASENAFERISQEINKHMQKHGMNRGSGSGCGCGSQEIDNGKDKIKLKAH